MKTTKILYWVFTALLIILMSFSVIGTFFNSEAGRAFGVQFGYPFYVFQLLAVAKILGIVALLVPGFPRIKEWAYAGFTFDLLGAMYSFYMPHKFPAAQWAPMLIFGLILIFGSYITYHKLLKAKIA